MGAFENFTLLFLTLTQKHPGRQRSMWSRAKPRAVHTEGWMGHGFCRTRYNPVIKLWVREHLGSHFTCWKQFTGRILQLKTCLINFNTEPEGSLEQQFSIFRWSLTYKYSHWELPVGALRLVWAAELTPTSWAQTLHYRPVLSQHQFLSLLYFVRKAQEAPIFG